VPYTHFDHISDIGIRSEAPTLEGAFEDGVRAMLDVMFELDTIEEKVSVEITAGANDVEALFVEVLNEVLSVQGRDELALRSIETGEIKRTEGGFTFRGTARGEKIDLEKHGVKTEVKGATYSALKYERVDGMHVLQCVLDV